ncbi:zinc finger protein PLAG1-like [Cylas formicarius]|uniref:zinc finger protein PLAG1-like n=1 Tax=Cylas formicarius TaxID=197179 RepID=UPI0029583A79|nr:zinc finger protein PLAG1-like [Cylas formicarius]XP_060536747.1 zinc finger protein PLAG1-like [Cylas formicarius]
MGTPGDKTNFEMVVPDAQSTVHAEPEPEEPPTTAEVPSTSQQQTTARSIVEMGVVTQLPQLHVLTTTPSGIVPPVLSKPEIFQQQGLEQASIEDYFTQSKFYPGLAEHLQPLYTITESQSPPVPVTFHSIDQPGPSGLQMIKNKPPLSAGKVKKKKPDQGAHKKNHTCPVCHKSFATGDKLNRHYQTHAGAAQYKCEDCKKSFSSKFKLVRHALIHSDRKPFSCTVCERTFHRKDHLKNHIKIHSPTKKLYECEKADCKKQYTSLLSYRKHLAVHAAEEGNLTCQICSSSFTSKEEIMYHLKIHAGSRTVKNPNEKKFVCEYCDRRFFTKKDVRRHLVVHTGMRDFLCQFCPQRFGRKDHLVRHIKKSHNRQYAEGPDGTVSVKTERAKSETVTSGELSDEAIFEQRYKRYRSQEIGESSKVKTEPLESTKLESESFKAEVDIGLEGVKTIFEEESLTPLEEEQLFLSPQSTQSELKELCSEIFKDIDQTPSTSGATPLDADADVGPAIDAHMFEFLRPTEESKRPLPGFSQTFQPPPPP